MFLHKIFGMLGNKGSASLYTLFQFRRFTTSVSLVLSRPKAISATFACRIFRREFSTTSFRLLIICWFLYCSSANSFSSRPIKICFASSLFQDENWFSNNGWNPVEINLSFAISCLFPHPHSVYNQIESSCHFDDVSAVFRMMNSKTSLKRDNDFFLTSLKDLSIFLILFAIWLFIFSMWSAARYSSK